MDITIEPAKPRSLVRRASPWVAAWSLFAVGGYAVYRCSSPVWQDYDAVLGEDATSTAAASSSPAEEEPSRQRLKDLFGSTQAMAAADSPAETSDLAPASRYGNAASSPQAAADLSSPPDFNASAEASASLPPAPPTAGNRYGEMRATQQVALTQYHASAAAAEDGTMINPFASPAPPATEAAASPVDVASPPIAAESQAVPSPDESPATSEGNPLRAALRRAARNPAEEVARAAFAGGAAPATEEDSAPVAAPVFPSPAHALQVPAAAAGSEASSVRDEANQEEVGPALAAPTIAIPAAAMPGAALPSAKLQASGGQPTLALQLGSTAPSPPSLPSDQMAAAPLAAATGPVGDGRPGERSLLGAQTPAVTLEKIAPPEIQVGVPCQVVLRVVNRGQQAAVGVEIVDELPAGMQLVKTSPPAVVAGGRVQWDLGELAAGEQRTLEVTLLPVDEGDLGSVATLRYGGRATAISRSTRPQLELQLTSAPRVMVGDLQRVDIVVANPGSGAARDVVLLETIPQEVRHEAGQALEFPVGTLQPGESRRLELMLTAAQAGTVRNIMTAQAAGSLEVQAACEFEIIAPALELSVDGPQRRYLERPATYTVSVANPGTAAAREVQVITQLPRGLKFVSANNMGEYDAATHSVYWSLAELPANERGLVELTALPVEAGEQTLQVASRAMQGLEDRTETKTVVEGLAALSFEVKASDQMIEVGGSTRYEIRVTNQGSKAASHVQVVAVTPAGLQPTAAQGDAGHAIQGDRVTFAPLATLPPQGTASFVVEVQGRAPGDQRLRVEVTSDEVRDPIIKQESTRVYADE